MSALEVMYPPAGVRNHLHVVHDGETSPHLQRQIYGRAMNRAYTRTRAKIMAELASACLFVVTLSWAMVVGFLSIPNTPLP
ncbi:MAG: hypothetical protein FWG15_01110 [Propionibacteriaceae bacterium]|nr:hypothetical protein [Propionibacteriaceae bacterium]